MTQPVLGRTKLVDIINWISPSSSRENYNNKYGLQAVILRFDVHATICDFMRLACPQLYPQVYQSLLCIGDRQLASFISWLPSSIQVAPTHKLPYLTTSHRVSGLMLDNYTSIASLFTRMLDQYDRLRKLNALLEKYQKEKMFENGLEDVDDSRATVEELLKECEACENACYISYVGASYSRKALVQLVGHCRF
ncbi:Tubulin/FtsZ [Gautieria morchelliformis]|nr:Tubulin/FtsZ [Gautieria morchelliformis]